MTHTFCELKWMFAISSNSPSFAMHTCSTDSQGLIAFIQHHQWTGGIESYSNDLVVGITFCNWLESVRDDLFRSTTSFRNTYVHTFTNSSPYIFRRLFVVIWSWIEGWYFLHMHLKDSSMRVHQWSSCTPRPHINTNKIYSAHVCFFFFLLLFNFFLVLE